MVVAIEGLIGVGKSTVLRELERRGHSVEFEQVDHWTLLPKMYATQAQDSEAAEGIRTLFEIQIICSLASRSATDFTERSIESAMDIFMPLLVKDEDMKSLIRSVASLAQHRGAPPSLYVYLDADVDLCLQRLSLIHI